MMTGLGLHWIKCCPFCRVFVICYLPTGQGAVQACNRLSELQEFRSSQTFKVNPDRPQQQARFATLEVSVLRWIKAMIGLSPPFPSHRVLSQPVRECQSWMCLPKQLRWRWILINLWRAPGWQCCRLHCGGKPQTQCHNTLCPIFSSALWIPYVWFIELFLFYICFSPLALHRREKFYWSQLLAFALDFSIKLFLPKVPTSNSSTFVPLLRFQFHFARKFNYYNNTYYLLDVSEILSGSETFQRSDWIGCKVEGGPGGSWFCGGVRER